MRRKVLTEAEILKIGRKRIDRQTPEEKQILQDYWEDRLKKMGESEDRARPLIQTPHADLGDWVEADEDVEEIRLSGDEIREVISVALEKTALTPEEKQILEPWLADITRIKEDVTDVFRAEIARKPRGKPRKVFSNLNSMESDV